MRTWLPLTLSQTNSMANGTIRSSREKRKRVSRDSAEVVQVILRRPLSTSMTPTNTPPVANAGQDQIVECAGSTGTRVTLSGSASSDPDDDPLTFEWKNAAGSVIG